MYFWNYTRLAMLLDKNGSKPPYYKGYCVFFVIFALLALNNAVSPLVVPHSPYAIARIVIFTLVVAAWLAITRKINENGDKQNYMNRLICLNLPVVIRTLVLSLFIMTATTLVMQKTYLPWISMHIRTNQPIEGQFAQMQDVVAKLNLGLFIIQLWFFMYWTNKAFIVASRKASFFPRGAVI